MAKTISGEQSCISYSPKEFLVPLLTSLMEKGYISDYAIIKHKGELAYDFETDSEFREKDHYHVWFYLVDSVRLKQALEWFTEGQFLEVGEVGLHRVHIFRSSHLADWLLYGIHNIKYLRAHNPSEANKEFTYKISDVISSVDYSYLFELASRELATDDNLYSIALRGYTWAECIAYNLIGYRDFTNKKQWYLETRETLKKNGSI